MNPAQSNGRSGGRGAKPRPVPAPVFMCVMCCQAFKRDLQEGINPAITLTVLFVNGIPVPVPVCIQHLDAPEGGEPKAVETRKMLVNPFTGEPF